MADERDKPARPGEPAWLAKKREPVPAVPDRSGEASATPRAAEPRWTPPRARRPEAEPPGAAAEPAPTPAPRATAPRPAASEPELAPRPRPVVRPAVPPAVPPAAPAAAPAAPRPAPSEPAFAPRPRSVEPPAVPLGPSPAGPPEALDEEPSWLPGERPRRSVQPRVGPRPFEMERQGRERSGLLTGLAIGAVLLLLWSLAMPPVPAATFRGGWLDIGDLGGSSFLAALFAVLVVLVTALPFSAAQRSLLLLLAGGLLLAFGLYHLEEDLLRMVYRNHPALHHLVIAHRSGLALALAALLVPAALFGRAAREDALAPKVLAAVGVAAAIAVYLFDTPPGGDGSAAAALLDVLRSEGTLRGDRLAAWFAFGPLVLLPTTLLVFLPPGRRAPTAAIALLHLALVIGALVVLAAHVAKPSSWLDALPALKTAFLLAAGLLLAPAALGRLASRLP